VKDFDRAEAEYNKAIEIDRTQADYYSDRGLAFAANGEYERALADYDRALAIDPIDAQAFDSRGGAYVGKGDYDRAITDFTTAIELHPGHAVAWEHRGYARFYRGDFRDAAADLSHALELGDGANAMLFLFLARSRAGEPAAAELAANARRLKTAAWPYALIELHLGRGTPETVLANATDQVQRCQAQFHIGEADILPGKLAEARAALHVAAETCPKTRIEYDAAIAELKRLGP
jgi:lipoprotein NlpI